MIYPKDFENKIGFKSIKNRLTELCISEMGKEFVEKMRFCPDIEKIKTRLSQIEDFLSLLQNGVTFPIRDYNDLRNDFRHLSIEGTVIIMCMTVKNHSYSPSFFSVIFLSFYFIAI